MLHSTVSAILEAERRRARAWMAWIAALAACHAAWASLMFVLLAAMRPATAFSAEYVGLAALWCAGHRVITHLKPQALAGHSAVVGEAF